jgi:hypothetical protein
MQSCAATMTTLAKLDPSLTGRIRISPVICYASLRLLNLWGYTKQVRNLAGSVYDLIPTTHEQLKMFASPTSAGKAVTPRE